MVCGAFNILVLVLYIYSKVLYCLLLHGRATTSDFIRNKEKWMILRLYIVKLFVFQNTFLVLLRATFFLDSCDVHAAL
jgi:hypothetical protein